MRIKLLRFVAITAALTIALGAVGCKKVPPGTVDETPDSSSPGTVSRPENGGTTDKNKADYWLANTADAKGLLMDAVAITAYNEKLTLDGGSKCVDLSKYPDTSSKAELTALLDEDKIPTDERFAGKTKVDAAYYTKLTQNLGQAGVKDSNAVLFGFLSQNTVMRTFPTTDPSYEFADDAEFDLFAETMLKIWEPVCILHLSTDGKWYFVQSRNYAGWIPVTAVATAPRAQWEQYLEMQNPLVVTGNRVTLNENVYNDIASGLELFMGTVLPMVPESEIPETIDQMSTQSGHAVLLPVRSDAGALSVHMALIPHNADVAVGYLPYTRENVLREAFKLLGDRHGWSGLNKSRDATSLVTDVFGVFGLHLPRNSAQQAALPGEKLELSSLSEADKTAKLLTLPAGTLLTMNGHVALYLGVADGVPSVLHSIYVAYDEGKQEKIYNTIMVSDLSLRDKDGNTYLSQMSGALSIR